MKKLALSAIAAGFTAFISLLSFSSCTQEGDNITYVISGTPVEENKNFVTQGIPFIDGTDTDIKNTVYTRIYDGNTYLPYVGLSYWLTKTCGIQITNISYSNNEYTISSIALNKSFPIVVNTKNSTIYCPAIVGYVEPAPAASFSDTAKFLDFQKVFTGQKSITYDLGKYGFKIYGGIEDAYIPLCVANQLFTCQIKYEQYLYNGVNIYRYDLNNSKYTTFKDSPWYKDLNNRPKELIDISYRLLCMTHDYLYGHSGYYGFADGNNGYADAAKVAEADKLSFDEFMSLPENQETKDLLKSSSYADYLKGIKQMTMYCYGDLHASFKVKSSSFLTLESSDIKAAIAAASKSKKQELYLAKRGIKTDDDFKETGIYDNSLEYWRKEKGIAETDSTTNKIKIKQGKELELIDGGKTLIIRFDKFDMDIPKWAAYYTNSPTILPDPDTDFTGSTQAGFNSQNLVNSSAPELIYPNDTIGLFYKAFYYIYTKKNDENGDYSKVKTVLIDDSCNGGGMKIILQYLLDLIAKNGDLYYDDYQTGTQFREVTKADLNLDGQVDSADTEFKEKFKDLNIAILTSFRSFSCGNALPFFAKEQDSNIKIIGERSGGGSCIVGSAVTADGFPFLFSFNMRLSSSDFSKTDEGGVEVDYDLTEGTWESSSYYSKFYDNEALITALKTVFGDKYPSDN